MILEFSIYSIIGIQKFWEFIAGNLLVESTKNLGKYSELFACSTTLDKKVYSSACSEFQCQQAIRPQFRIMRAVIRII